MDSGDHVATYVPAFELFTAVIGNTLQGKQVTTRVIGIKCNTVHYALLRELFSQLFTNPPSDIAHIKFMLSGILTIIGTAAYQNLIHDNNQHFNNLATIPIAGIIDAHVDIDICIVDPKESDRCMTLREILLTNEWCSTVETTHMDGQLLLTTNKCNLLDACQWLDTNLEPLFTKHLTKNQQFQLHPEYPFPQCMDHISVTSTTKQSYAEKLMNGIPPYATTVTDKDKFLKFPMKHHDKNPKCVYDENHFPKLNTLPIPQPTDSATIKSTANSNNPGANTYNKPKVDLKAIQAKLKKSLTTDFTKLINAAINNFQAKMKTSFEKLDNCYDDLSTTVAMLNQPYQCLNSTLEQIQNNLLSSSRGGDGHA